MSFAEEVKKLREAVGISQADLARQIGVNQSFVSKVERGERPGLGADVYLKLCDALGVKCDHFREFLAPPSADPAPPVEKPKRGRPPKAMADEAGEGKKAKTK
jgi:transcriptional regulator with XRE-family HTH domain